MTVPATTRDRSFLTFFTLSDSGLPVNFLKVARSLSRKFQPPDRNFTQDRRRRRATRHEPPLSTTARRFTGISLIGGGIGANFAHGAYSVPICLRGLKRQNSLNL
jgi:hypothetical protein